MSILPYSKTDTLLKVDNVSLKLGTNQILKNISFEVKDIVRPGVTQGQIIGLLGPSGVGKSFLLKILSGIQNPDSGQVLIGKEQKPVKVGDVGFVQQNYPLFNHRTVFGNMETAASLKIKDKNERKDKINSLLDRFDLMKVVNLYPSQLSGGQRQRAAIVQQVLCSNHFILLDEPSSGLDPLVRDKVLEVINEVANLDEFNSVIIVSHDIASTASISDTLWLMGREKDENGQFIPGAMIKYQFDLIERDLCWHKDIENNINFVNLVKEVRSLFSNL